MRKIALILFMLLLLTSIVSAATIHGTVYDFSLAKIRNIVVEIDTIPAQRQISTEGTYSFNIPSGSYTITAKTKANALLTSENITIIEEGNYTLDLISFIDTSEEQELLNDTDIEIDSEIEQIDRPNYTWLIIIIIGIVLGVLSYIYFYIKKKRPISKEEKNEEIETDLAEKVLSIIKKNEGRTTQKELRKLLPYSEAKVSLIITELESKGQIQKIKKGRSNVIILKK